MSFLEDIPTTSGRKEESYNLTSGSIALNHNTETTLEVHPLGIGGSRPGKTGIYADPEQDWQQQS